MQLGAWGMALSFWEEVWSRQLGMLMWGWVAETDEGRSVSRGSPREVCLKERRGPPAGQRGKWWSPAWHVTEDRGRALGLCALA